MLPPIFNNSVAGSTSQQITSSLPALVSGGQMALFMYQLGFTGAQAAGVVGQIAAESTIFTGRFVSDIMVLYFTQPSSLSSRLGVGSSLASAVESAPIVSGKRLQNAAALLPNFYAFVFRINPSAVQRTQTRVRNTTLTKGGYLTQYWSAGMKVMSYSGSSGAMVPDDPSVDLANFNIRQTVAYANFKQLRQFYEQANQDVGLFAQGSNYLGVLSEFSFTVDADAPYEIKYSMKFEAYPEYAELG